MKIIYNGNGYCISQEDGKFFFSDDNVVCELAHEIKHPEYIHFDENKGWCYKNGKQLPWADEDRL